MAGGMTRIRRRLLAGLCKGMALAATMTAMPATAAPAAPVRNDDLALVQKHIRAVTTLTASFTQTDARGQTQSGTFLWKQPGQIRFQYGGGVPLLIVADGRALTMIDYEVRQVQRWPIRNSPLGALLDPTRDVTRYGKVVETGDPRVLSVDVRDPAHPEFGVINLVFTRDGRAPAGLSLYGWVAKDAQGNRTVIRLTGNAYGAPIADSAFKWTDPRPKGPR
jgi:outer membrane lipoprotein-sorting protein